MKITSYSLAASVRNQSGLGIRRKDSALKLPACVGVFVLPALVRSSWFHAVYCVHCASTHNAPVETLISQRVVLLLLFLGAPVQTCPTLRTMPFCLQSFIFPACLTVCIILSMHRQSAAVFVYKPDFE